MKKENHAKKAVALIVFSIAMALLESAVVIYLRALYYPDGFSFPMKDISDIIGLTELLRELATLVMLGGIGYLAGNNRLDRWGWFMVAFGIWDIFYYIFLYLIIGWPVSYEDMDILFLIPMPWYGPVYAPCLIAMALIVYGGLMIWGSSLSFPIYPDKLGKSIFLASCIIHILVFTWPYFEFCQARDLTLRQGALSYKPEFSLWAFAVGYSTLLTSILYYAYRLTHAEKLRIKAYF